MRCSKRADRKGFPDSYDLTKLLNVLGDVKSGKDKVEAPVYSHLIYDVLPDQKLSIERPDIVIVEGKARIDESIGWLRSRLFLAMLAALVLIAAVAYIQGRSIVGTLGRLADAARGIARGRLGDRVHVRGRDEFASLAHAFNQMADQLQARMTELED